MNRPEFEWVRRFLKTESAIVLEEGKEYLLESRLLSLRREHNYEDVWTLLGDLSRGKVPHLKRAVIDAMTTNETSFFRDAQPFKLLEERIIPEHLAQFPNRPLTILCAACSSGQEPYSIGILLNEKFPALVRDKQVKIRAWDLCETILEEARKGEYSQMAVNRGLPAMQLIKYFKKSGSRWTVKPKVREIVTFESMNLARPWPSVRADVVFLRNVLIYFDVATKSKILGEVRKVLRPGGYMFMGAAESTRGLDATFERVAFNRGCCYQLPGGSKTSTDSASRRLAG